MKVVLVTTSFPKKVAGAEAAGAFVFDFCRSLGEIVEVAVVAPGDANDEMGCRMGNIRVFRYKSPSTALSGLSPWRPDHWFSIFRTLYSGNKVSLRAAERFGADHIFALWALPSGYWARHAAHLLRIPYSTWALGSDIWALGKLPVVRTILAKVMLEAEYRFADGYRLTLDVEELTSRPCQFLASARALPICGLKLRHRPPYRLAFLGRWHRNKGIDLLFDALDLLADSDWRRIECVRIEGGGELENMVRHRAQILANQGRPVKIGAYLDPYQAAELLNWTDLVLIPSRIESIPVIYSDAVQAARPVLATPVGDFEKLRDETKDDALILCGDVTGAAFCLSLSGVVNRDCIEIKDRGYRSLLGESVERFYMLISNTDR